MMGYYTNFTLDIYGKDFVLRGCEHEFDSDFSFCPTCGKARELDSLELVNHLPDVQSGYDIRDVAIGHASEWKWYSHDKDMRLCSAQLPELTFVLTGHGEDSGDLWRKWYQAGNLLSEWKADATIPEWPEGFDDTGFERLT